jgi:signal transduction histidine kinase/DNA-binding response OmpR family regulator
MPGAQQPTVRDALREEFRPLILSRVRWVLLISTVGLTMSALSDLRHDPAPVDLIGLKMAGALAQACAALLTLRAAHWTWSRSIAISMAGWSIACLATSANGLYTGDPIMPGLLLPIMIVGAAIVLPWGVGPQIALAVLAGALLLPHVPALGTNMAVSAYSVFAVSIYIAIEFDKRQRERKALELLQAGQQRVLEGIAADAPLADVSAALLETVEQQSPELSWAVVQVNSEDRRLYCVAAVGLPGDYQAAIDQVGNAGGHEPSAVAARAGHRVIADDLSSDPVAADVASLAASVGLRASCSEPILSEGSNALGVVSVYRRRPGPPSTQEIRLLESTARLFGIAVEHRESRERIERYVRALDVARQQAEQQAQQLREQAVELAEARDQALASMRARSQFLANMSHEIRTPLNGILGTAEILLDSGLSAEQREYAGILTQCGDHLLCVINDILDLSKIEAGRIDLERVEIDLRALVEEVAGILASRAQQKGLELVTSIPPELDASVRGDPARLRQVLVNLVGNAIKFTDAGEVVIEARLLGETDTQLSVRLSVRDTGIGIPLHRQAAVFESFTQADGSTTRTHGGTGLGLTISKQIVQLMGGEIGLHSIPGKGSTFWIDLPFERGTGARRPVSPLREQLVGLRVLIVDDTAINRLILRRTLDAWGCRVHEAASGHDALAQLDAGRQGEPYGLIILDMQMPELNGIETAQRIQANPRHAGVPIILLSSIGGFDSGDGQSKDAGFAAIVTKPVRQSALLDRILSVLGAPAAGGEPQPAADSARRALALRVLLVEDNRVNQLVAERLLDKLGCQSDVVDNGRDAVQAAGRTHYDVILMDVQMPLMDGFEATALIRRHEPPGVRVPIIAMTAHAMEGDRERCLAAGMDGYVAKPVSLAALAASLAGLRDALGDPATAPAADRISA